VDGVVYVAPYSGPLTALEAATGKQVFAGPVDTTVFAEPVIARDTIYLAQQEGRIVALKA
jgi:outer membrane protein assembly factor BamB